MQTKISSRYKYETLERPKVQFLATDKKSKSRTMQSDMDAADINKLMARFEKTGVIVDTSGIERKPMFGDFTQFAGYHEMLSSVREADRYFLTLPAKLRNKFDNDVEKFIAFGEDPANKAEMQKLGLLDPDPIDYVDKDGKPVNKDGTPRVPKAPGQPANPVA